MIHPQEFTDYYCSHQAGSILHKLINNTPTGTEEWETLREQYRKQKEATKAIMERDGIKPRVLLYGDDGRIL